MDVLPERTRKDPVGRSQGDLLQPERQRRRPGNEWIGTQPVGDVSKVGTYFFAIVRAPIVAQPPDLGAVVIADDNSLPQVLGQCGLERSSHRLPSPRRNPDVAPRAKDSLELFGHGLRERAISLRLMA